MRRFAAFACIDWSGARGDRLPGMAIAEVAAGDAAPRLIPPPNGAWSRAGVRDWLVDQRDRAILIGLDLSPALPFEDRGAYLPGSACSAVTARNLWAYVDAVCADEPHHAAGRFADAHAPHFRIGVVTGALFGAGGGQGRLRRTEAAARAMGLRPTSCFNLVGPAQVGRASLTGMRILADIGDRLPFWPFDPPEGEGALLVEVYTTIAARAAGITGGSKMRTIAALNRAVAAPAIASLPVAGAGAIDDHSSDALLTAAWLRRVAGDPGLWSPPAMPAVRASEGWTFGVP